MNDKKKVSASTFIESILKFSVSSWVNFFISIVSVMIITRIFSPGIYGTINIFNSASILLTGVACLGLDSSFLRFYNEPPEGDDGKQLLAKCMIISIGFFIILSILLFSFFYNQISMALFNKVSLVIMVMLCTNAFSFILLNYFSTCYRMRNDARNYTIQSILLQFFSKCFVITAALIDPDLSTVITFNTIGVFALALVYFFIQKNDILPIKLEWSYKGYSEVFKFAFFSWPIVIIIHLNTFLSHLIINWKLGSYDLGIYASAGLFIGILAVIQNGFRTYWASFMYTHYKTEQSFIKGIHNYVLFFVVVVLCLFIIFQNVIYLFLGENYHASQTFFTLVLVYPLFQLISQTTAYGITIAKKTHYSLLVSAISTFVNVAGCYIIISFIGIIGAAIASMLSAIIELTLFTIIGQKYYQSISHPVKTIISCLIVLLLAVSNCILIDKYLYEMIVILVILIITGFLFKEEVTEMHLFLKINIKMKS